MDVNPKSQVSETVGLYKLFRSKCVCKCHFFRLCSSGGGGGGMPAAAMNVSEILINLVRNMC